MGATGRRPVAECFLRSRRIALDRALCVLPPQRVDSLDEDRDDMAYAIIIPHFTAFVCRLSRAFGVRRRSTGALSS